MVSMAQVSPSPPRPHPATALPVVRLDVRAGGAVTSYTVGDTGFLLGSVPGCDLRLPGASQPPVLALVSRHPGGASVRKLAPIGAQLLNGQNVSQAALRDGDHLSLGAVDITVSVSPSVPVMRVQLYDAEKDAEGALAERARQLDEREQLLAGQAEELETDRAIWYRRRQEIEEECRGQEANAALEQQLREERLAAALGELAHREESMQEERAELAAQRHELSQRAARVGAGEEELARVRREMDEIRQQFADRYRQRRDRLANMQAALRRAARRLQERKRQFDGELQRARALDAGEGDPRAELNALAEELATKAQALQHQHQQLQERERGFQAETGRRLADLAERERKLAEGRDALQKSQAQHQIDLVRLDRLAASLEQRQRQLQRNALEVDRRYEALQRDTRELEEQATQLDEWHTRLEKKGEETEGQQKELEAGRAELAARTAALEGQQAMVATLRMRMERLREEHRRQEQALAEQRARQDGAEAETQERLADARRLSRELQAEKELHEEQQKQFDLRRGTLEAAVAQLRQAQERLAAEGGRLEERGAELDAVAAEQREQAGLLQARAAGLDEQHERLRDDRQALAERASILARAEQVLATLQEQIRRRSDELATRQNVLEEKARQDEAVRAEVEAQKRENERFRQEAAEELAASRADLDARKARLEEGSADLVRREEQLRGAVEELGAARHTLEGDFLALAADRERLADEQQRAAGELALTRDAVEAARAEAAALREELPGLEQRAAAALERLAQAREQLREHLAEVHGYVREGRADLEALRGELGAEQERLRHGRDEHRLAVAAFRQELIAWQGQLGELKLTLAQGETRLERRQAAVEEQAQHVATTSQRLAEQAEQLQQQQRAVAEKRQEMDRHLADMREWYRRKLRELARGREDAEGRRVDAGGEDGGDEPRRSPTILTLTGEVEPGDRQLGETLRSLGLVDADTLTALLVEARRQRRSLRELLMDGNYLTLFQMALIEAGNLDGLVLGPVRTIDRLHSTPREAVYRVFDPRSNREALLRHLAESEMHDAVRPDEFRQRFAAARAVRHPHVAATHEVLEIAGRPAALQEWLAGLTSNEWPSLAAVPGVWHRLMSQAALGLSAAHQAGLAHCNLHPGQVVFTPDGVLKLCGFGEPSWLALEPPPEEGEPSEAADLAALGRCAATWTTPSAERKGPKPKPLPASLQAVLGRLCGEGAGPYASAAALLDDLDAAGADIPPNAAAWERFVRQVREQSGDTPLRRSA